MSKPIQACDCEKAEQTVQNLGGHDACGKGIARPIDAYAGAMELVDGTPNGIILGTDIVSPAYFDAKFNNQIAEDRWLPLLGLTDYDSPIVDPNIEEIDDGRTFVLNKNAKEVTFSIVTNEFATLAAKIEALGCRDFGFKFKDANKSLLGHHKYDTLVTFRRVQPGSLRVDTVEPTTGNVGRVQVRFKWDRSALDTEVDYFTASNLGGYNLDDTKALIDGNIKNMVATVNTLAFRIESDFGSEEGRIGLGGLSETTLDITADGVVEPVTGIAATAILGDYLATFSSPVTIGEKLEVRGIGGAYGQIGYDLKNLIGVEEEVV